MKLAFSTNAFRKHSLFETIGTIAAIGYDGIEIMADSPHAYPPDLSDDAKSEIIRAVSTSNLEICNVNAFMMCAIQDFHYPSWIEEDPKRREMRLQHTINCIDLAAELGADRISTEPGGPLDGQSYDEAMAIFVEGVSQIAEKAKSRGVKILVEPEPALLIETSAQFKDFIKRVDTEAIGLNLDVGHFFCVGEDPCDAIRELRDYIGHFHLEDIAASREHKHLALGEGAVDIPKILKTIREIGYKGYVTIELYPYEEQAADVAKRAFQYMRSVL